MKFFPKSAKRVYQTEMDVISAFLDSDCIQQGGEIKASVLYAVYCKWADENNEYKKPSRKFGIEMSKRYNKKKVNGNIVYTGISLFVNSNS